ncbi:MAG: cbb3-type cytochrome c oxidase subunit I [Chloroflexi bacterium]|nr:cbb3-type cytochrome c oxidase subunit I [Chloroflexota bacterium]
MPTIVRWYVKTALLYLALALGLGILLAAGIWRAALTPSYWHLFIVGWLTQLIFGIALWMLPSFTRERPRGNELLSWAVYVVLNAGLLLRAIAEPLRAVQVGAAALWGQALVISAILQWLAALGFVINAWPRVRGPRRKTRQGGA